MAIVFQQVVASTLEVPVCAVCRQEHKPDSQEQVVLVRRDLVLCESCIVVLWELVGCPTSTPLLDPDLLLARPNRKEDLPTA